MSALALTKSQVGTTPSRGEGRIRDFLEKGGAESAVELELNEEGEQAFLRLSKSLYPLSRLITQLGEDLILLGEGVDMVKAEDIDLTEVSSDLEILAKQVSDEGIRDHLVKVAQVLATSQLSKDDLITTDLAEQGGLRSPGSAQDLTPRFTVEREVVEGEDDTYRVRDTNTNKIVSSSLSETGAHDLASRRNMALRKATGENLGIFLRVPEELARSLPSIADRDPSPRHATMLIIGQVDPTQYVDVIEAVQEVAKGIEAFGVELEDFGEFKNHKNETVPHLIPRATGEITLAEIHRSLKEALVQRGIDPVHHDGPFKAHVTLAYVPEGETFKGDRPSGTFDADHLEIWGEADGEFGKVSVSFETGDQQSLTKSVVSKRHHVQLLKAEGEEDEDEHTVFGIVLEPEVVDSQGDIYSEEEIRQTAYRFLERYQTFGLQHQEMVPEILPLESYLAPVDMVINGHKIKKGTWLLRIRVLDADIWADVKSGKLTGFSIGGSAIRTPELLRTAA